MQERDFDKYFASDMKEFINELNTYSIELGVFEDEDKRKESNQQGVNNAELMWIHENGSPIRRVPARPVIQLTLAKFVNERLDRLVDKMIESYLSTQDKSLIELYLSQFAIQLAQSAQVGIRRKEFKLAPNSPRTIAKKGSDIPLLDTGQLSRSIQARIIKR